SRACRVCCASPNGHKRNCLAHYLPIHLVEEAHEDQVGSRKINVLVGWRVSASRSGAERAELNDCRSCWTTHGCGRKNMVSIYFIVCYQSVRVHGPGANREVVVSLITSTATRTEPVLVAHEVERCVLCDGYWIEGVIDNFHPVDEWCSIRRSPTGYRDSLGASCKVERVNVELYV